MPAASGGAQFAPHGPSASGELANRAHRVHPEDDHFQQDLLVKKPRIKERDVITAGIERGLQELREAQNKLDELRKTVPALPRDLSSSKNLMLGVVQFLS